MKGNSPFVFFLFFLFAVLNSPVVVHHHDRQADLFHVLGGDVKDDGLVVRGVERAFLGGRLSLLQPPSSAHHVNLHVRVWKA